jgi:hypothetical protein
MKIIDGEWDIDINIKREKQDISQTKKYDAQIIKSKIEVKK